MATPKSIVALAVLWVLYNQVLNSITDPVVTAGVT